ncbi:translation initiation factor IF-2-like [Nycticebus coucang]|uniref:translation initiation factor IF-2-like n=1 Tax=Nycticebus coucang TaxID=9470 RepID=UPI00234C3434|nr:translation initiation factor IF-2-like [Nycticebus coucang]XP_053414341.1 translation initiation factor IF-2-like [Nycticebus coucang]XP_053414342.1 translation initiation factor IF-2-like [Nycticebus coucang]XP_053414343.1 translation initiation factor IF-2-like [Nycticebus coucang]XP_053414344.1 translation initiation factor IF-2-like [Nycticebus coucang]
MKAPPALESAGQLARQVGPTKKEIGGQGGTKATDALETVKRGRRGEANRSCEQSLPPAPVSPTRRSRARAGTGDGDPPAKRGVPDLGQRGPRDRAPPTALSGRAAFQLRPQPSRPNPWVPPPRARAAQHPRVPLPRARAARPQPRLPLLCACGAAGTSASGDQQRRSTWELLPTHKDICLKGSADPVESAALSCPSAASSTRRGAPAGLAPPGAPGSGTRAAAPAVRGARTTDSHSATDLSLSLLYSFIEQFILI